MGRVHDQVERVVDRYAQYDAGYTDDDDGDIAPEQGHPTHGKEPSPSYGQENQQNITEGTYGISMNMTESEMAITLSFFILSEFPTAISGPPTTVAPT